MKDLLSLHLDPPTPSGAARCLLDAGATFPKLVIDSKISFSLGQNPHCSLPNGDCPKPPQFAICLAKGVVAYVGADNQIYPPDSASPTPSY